MVFEDDVVELQLQRAFDAAAGPPKRDILNLDGHQDGAGWRVLATYLGGADPAVHGGNASGCSPAT